jgi:hypothetical protein
MPPIEEIWDALLQAVLPALATAAIFMALLTLVGGAKQAPAGAAFGFIAGTVLSLWLRGALTLASGESTWNRLPWAALAALCVGRVARIPGLPIADGSLLRAATAFGIAWWVVPETVSADFSWLAPAFAAVIFLEWVILDPIADGSTAVCLTLTLLVAGGVLLHARMTSSLDAATACGSAMAGLAVVAWWCRVDVTGAIPAVAVILPGLLLMGQTGTAVETLHWTTFALPVLAPLLLAVTLPIRQTSDFRWYVVRLGLVLIPLVAALALAHQQAPYNFDE